MCDPLFWCAIMKIPITSVNYDSQFVFPVDKPFLFYVIHGANDNGAWVDEWSNMLVREEISGVFIQGLSHKPYPTKDLLLEIGHHERAQELLITLGIADDRWNSRDIDFQRVFVGHSHGTLIIRTILTYLEEIKPEWFSKLSSTCLVCSICTTADVRFISSKTQFSTIALCGTKDYYPLLASKISKLYGSIGTYGAHGIAPNVRTKYFEGGHAEGTSPTRIIDIYRYIVLNDFGTDKPLIRGIMTTYSLNSIFSFLGFLIKVFLVPIKIIYRMKFIFKS